MSSTFWASAVPPATLELALELKAAALFHLLRNDKTIAAGLAPCGLTRIAIPVDGLLGQSGEYRWQLELRCGSQTFRQPIILRVRCQSQQNSGQVNDSLRRQGFGVALFMENRLLAWRHKPLTNKSLSAAQADRDWRGSERALGTPPDPLRREEMALRRASLPLLGVPLMLMKKALARNKRKNDGDQTASPASDLLAREFSAVYLLPDSSSELQPTLVTVTLL